MSSAATATHSHTNDLNLILERRIQDIAEKIHIAPNTPDHTIALLFETLVRQALAAKENTKESRIRLANAAHKAHCQHKEKPGEHEIERTAEILDTLSTISRRLKDITNLFALVVIGQQLHFEDASAKTPNTLFARRLYDSLTKGLQTLEKTYKFVYKHHKATKSRKAARPSQTAHPQTDTVSSIVELGTKKEPPILVVTMMLKIQRILAKWEYFQTPETEQPSRRTVANATAAALFKVYSPPSFYSPPDNTIFKRLLNEHSELLSNMSEEQRYQLLQDMIFSYPRDASLAAAKRFFTLITTKFAPPQVLLSIITAHLVTASKHLKWTHPTAAGLLLLTQCLETAHKLKAKGDYTIEDVNNFLSATTTSLATAIKMSIRLDTLKVLEEAIDHLGAAHTQQIKTIERRKTRFENAVDFLSSENPKLLADIIGEDIFPISIIVPQITQSAYTCSRPNMKIAKILARHRPDIFYERTQSLNIQHMQTYELIGIIELLLPENDQHLSNFDKKTFEIFLGRLPLSERAKNQLIRLVRGNYASTCLIQSFQNIRTTTTREASL